MDHAACPVAFVVPRPRLHLSDSGLYFGGWVGVRRGGRHGPAAAAAIKLPFVWAPFPRPLG